MPKFTSHAWYLGLTLAAFAAPSLAASQGYYRTPALHDETIVFAAEGDLWTVTADGGTARRLTSNPGEETAPAVSPDGQTLAFSAAYEGPTEVYTVPLTGGVPTRRTWEAEPSTVVGWTPDNEVLYVTQHDATVPVPHLVRLDPDRNSRTVVPLHQASDGAFASDGTLFFVRPGFHRNNTQRYQGGTARNIWRFTPGDAEATNLTADFAGGDHSPMVWDGRVYYVNDRDGTMNLWSMRGDGTDLRQHTRHQGWDVRSPSLSDGRIVYQLGADLWRLDLATGVDLRLAINLASDFDQLRERWVDEPLENLTAYGVDAAGERLVLTVRGRVFVLPVGAGRRVQIARKPGVRFRDATFMPDGEHILLLSDESGELEFHLVAADGTPLETDQAGHDLQQRVLTGDGAILRFAGNPSPDGTRVSFTDKNDDLWILDVASGTQTQVSTLREGIGEHTWSPDSRYLAYVQRARNSYLQIFIFDTVSGDRMPVTSDRTNSTSPAWSPDGAWLYFLSDRNLRSLVGSPWGPRQPEAFFDQPIGIFQVALEAGTRPPFRPHDELMPRPAARDAEPGTTSPKSDRDGTPPPAEVTPIVIDADGLANRLFEVPIPTGNYRALSTNGKALFWLAQASGPDAETNLMTLEIDPEDPKPQPLATNVRGYRLAQAGEKILVHREQGFSMVAARGKGGGGRRGDSPEPSGAPGKMQGGGGEKPVDLAGWRFSFSVREDFRQLFVDAWRLERDYFYDPGMHGTNWDAVRDKYLPLVDRVTTRAELSDLIGQAMAELSALHVSVRGGDLRRSPDDVRVATLGARLQRDEDAGGYRIDTIYRPDPDYPAWQSPLADPYLALREGAVILAINGTALLSVDHPGVLLRDQAGQQVLLSVRDADGAAPRSLIVTPTDQGRALRYLHWQHERRQMVESKGGGEIGYVHLQAMGSRNLSEWYRQFYPVFDRRGLIIDVRHNRGGNIDSLILEKLLRRAWFYWQGRVGQPTWNMQYAFRGHLVVLINERTASDGEAFAEGFRRLGLGKVIGTRTWGGEIWLSSNNRLSDGGLARAPQTGVYGPEREWLIEGHGVDPDIEVDNLPHESFNGRDRQLEAAITHLQALIAEDPRDVPAPPPYPDKAYKGPRDPGLR